MTDVSKKELVSNLYDAFADRVAELDKDLKDNHGYMNAAAQHLNLVTDIGAEVKEAGWQVSPAIVIALCQGGSELMALDLSQETIVPPPSDHVAAPPRHEPPPPAEATVSRLEQDATQHAAAQQASQGSDVLQGAALEQPVAKDV
jgi:hypothetical protein